MRARFSAFAIGDGEFLWATLHPEHPLRARPESEVVSELSNAHRRLRYQRLTVHGCEQTGSRAWVRFTAHVFERGQDRTFHERSEFELIDGTWRYAAGDSRPGAYPPDPEVT